MLKTAVKGGTDEGLCEGGLWVIVIAGGKAHAVLGVVYDISSAQ